MPDTQRECTIRFLSPMRGCTGRAADEGESACNVAWDPQWLAAPAGRFNPQLAAASMALACALMCNTQRNGFRYALGALEELGFADADVSSFEHRNEADDADYRRDEDLVAYAMGHAVVRDAAGEEVPLAVLAIRGTSRTPEWSSNANVADSVTDGNYNVEYHEGFDAAADEAYGRFARYLERHGIDPRCAKVWLCGHSRGGAVANIIGAFMCESGGFDPANVHAYAFAAPPATRRKDAQDDRFSGIFNVVDPTDCVPRLPLERWGFRRFGTTMYLPAERAGEGAPAPQPGVPAAYGARAAELYRQFTGQDERPAFASLGPTVRMVRDAASISPTLAVAYTRERRGKLGSKTAAQLFRDMIGLSGSRGSQCVLGSANAARLLVGPFKQFGNYFLKNRALGDRVSGTHSEEGHLARMLAAAQTGLDLPATRAARQTALTVYGELDVTVKDAAGAPVASIWKGKVEKGSLPAFFDSETGATTIWFPAAPASEADPAAVFVDPCPGYAVELRDRAGRSFGVTIAVQDAMGATLAQREYGPVKIGNGHTMAWDQLAPDAPFRDAAKGNDLRVTVRVEGGKRADAVGAECLTAGDWATVHAYEARGATFKGWFEEGRNLKVAAPLSTDRDYTLRVAENRALVALFE